jgi:hypothetical protein
MRQRAADVAAADERDLLACHGALPLGDVCGCNSRGRGCRSAICRRAVSSAKQPGGQGVPEASDGGSSISLLSRDAGTSLEMGAREGRGHASSADVHLGTDPAAKHPIGVHNSICLWHALRDRQN